MCLEDSSYLFKMVLIRSNLVSILNRLLIYFHKIAFFCKSGDSFFFKDTKRKLSQSTGSKGKFDTIACKNTELTIYSEEGQKRSWHAGDQKNAPAGLKMNTCSVESNYFGTAS